MNWRAWFSPADLPQTVRLRGLKALTPEKPAVIVRWAEPDGRLRIVRVYRVLVSVIRKRVA